MATVTSLGTGSGLDLEGLVTKLVAAESAPLTALKKQESSVKTKISSLGSLKSSLSSLQSAASAMKAGILESPLAHFSSYTASLANNLVGTATATTGAVAGRYSLEVTQLAKGQQLVSNTFAASSTVVSAGGGTLTLELGTLNGAGTTFTADSARTYAITVGANATLADVRNAINRSDSGVTATIVNGTNGAQLVLSGKEGAKNTMRLSGISGLTYDPTAGTGQPFSQSSAAQDALFSLNGIAASSSSNTVTSAIDGVTLQLSSTNTGTPTTLTVTQDTTANLTKQLQDFITAYNSTRNMMSNLGAYNPTTKVAGELQGSSTLSTAQSQLRAVISGTTSGVSGSNYQLLTSIGVTTGADGTLSLDSSKLNAALKAEPNTVATLVSNVGAGFNTVIGRMTTAGGLITSAVDGYNARVSSLQKQEAKVQDRIDAIEKRMRKQFSALDQRVASLTSTGTYITNYLNSLKANN